MKHRTCVRLCELEALRLFVSEDETRYVLCGLLVELSPDGTILVATDGRRMAILRPQSQFVEQTKELVSFIIPATLLRRLQSPIAREYEDEDGEIVTRTLSRNDAGNSVIVEFDSDTKRVRLTHHGEKYTVEGDAVDGAFPKWRAVIPSDRSDAPVAKFRSLNTEFLGDFGKAVELLENCMPRVTVFFHGTNDNEPLAMEVQSIGAPYFYGILMGCKAEELPSKPDWLRVAAKEVA